MSRTSTGTSCAVFLSYASQDAEAAQRICDALRAAAVEVWFDKSELRGGEAWDQSIRRQIRNCSLFIPIVSRHTHDRAEGYFRLEWKLAVDRSYLITPTKAFLVPVAIDDTPQEDDQVPDRFRELQWTRLPAGETPPAFVERVQRLLSGELVPLPGHARSVGGAAVDIGPISRGVVRWPGVLYGVGAMALLLTLGYLGFERLNGARPNVPSAASIAVLPLANESGEADQQYFSDGISEDLITALGQFPGLKVIGRSSAFQFRDSKVDSGSIGAKLGVAYLLEGSVRKSGDMIRVSAELIDTANGSMQWSARYDRPFKDLFALQDEITRAVTEALRTKLLPGEHAADQSERPASGSFDAYNAMLEGRFYALRDTEADYRKAIKFFTQAIALDPQYAFAWSKLSQAWSDLGGGYLEGAPAQEAYAKAREAVTRALELSPYLASAHVAHGYLLLTADFDWHGAEAEYRRALTLSPNNGLAKFNLGLVLATFGDVDHAIDLTRQALATDPLQSTSYTWLATYLSGAHRLDEAEKAIGKAIELQPTTSGYHAVLAIIEIQRGNAQAALAAAQQEPPGAWHDSSIALALQIGADRVAADAALKTLVDRDAAVDPFQIAEVYALRDDAQATFEWLDRAWSGRDSGVQNLLFDPFVLRYKDDPRFSAFCRKVGLPLPGEAFAHTST